MTKEELIGRKFLATDGITYTINDNPSKDRVTLNWVSSLRDITDNTSWGIASLLDRINEGTWKLLPIENKVYKTSKGIEYGVGFQFISSDNHHEIVKITPETVTIKWQEQNSLHNYPFETFAKNLDNWNITIINNTMKDYKQVDPKTIKFDFTSTKIKVNNRQEATWVIDCAVANGCDRPCSDGTYDKLHFYIWADKDICWANSLDEDCGSKYKEVTIQDILNNMKEVIEVGDVVTSKINITRSYTISKVDVDKDQVTYVTGGHDQLSTLDKHYTITKGKKKEVIAYETVVDLPGIPKGSKFEVVFKGGVTYKSASSDSYVFTLKELQDTKFFKPIYKQDALEIKFSKYTATLSKDNGLVFTDGEKLSFADTQKLVKLLANTDAKGKAGKFDVVIKHKLESVAVGCKSFTAADVKLVSDAVTKLQ